MLFNPNGVFRSTGQGFIKTQDGRVATYTSQVVGNVVDDGRVLSVGANFWSTPSTGKLAFLNDMMNIFKLQADPSWKLFSDGMGVEILDNVMVEFSETSSFARPARKNTYYKDCIKIVNKFRIVSNYNL